MTQTSGKLIVLEGPDGCGKTTLADALSRALTDRNLENISTSFPGRTPRTLGSIVYDLHHNHKTMLDRLPAASLQMLHVAAHIDSIESQIIPALCRGTIVILDRFWWSTWVYGLVGGIPRSLLTAILSAEHSLWKPWPPSAVFLIRRPGHGNSISRNDSAVLAREYESLAASEEVNYPVHRVSNDHSIDGLASAIMEKSGVVRPSRCRPCKRDIPQVELPFKAATEPRAPSPSIYVPLAPAKPTVAYDTYWRFAAERQEVFFRRMASLPPPWTRDPILLRHKFTNAYRASDRVSQFLIKHVIYSGDQSPDEVFFRTILFKLFNKIETWNLLRNKFGEVAFSDFSIENYDRALAAAKASGLGIYSAAYIMPSGGKASPAGPKHRMHLQLLAKMMRDELPSKVFSAKTLQAVFELLRSYPTIGDFLAYQYTIDLNYSSCMDHSENSFVVPGPGARDGIQKCFADRGGLNEAELIKVVTERQEQEFIRLGLSFRTLGGRSLQLIDCQNLFCEVDKYCRVKHPEIQGHSGRTRIKQKFEAKGPLSSPWYPPKWRINDRLVSDLQGFRHQSPSVAQGSPMRPHSFRHSGP